MYTPPQFYFMKQVSKNLSKSQKKSVRKVFSFVSRKFRHRDSTIVLVYVLYILTNIGILRPKYVFIRIVYTTIPDTNDSYFPFCCWNKLWTHISSWQDDMYYKLGLLGMLKLANAYFQSCTYYSTTLLANFSSYKHCLC